MPTHMQEPKPNLTENDPKRPSKARPWILASLLLLFFWQGSSFLANYLGYGEIIPLQCNVTQNVNADSEIPKGFDYQDYQKVIKTAIENYVDPNRVDKKRMFFASASAALQSLPTSLSLITTEFYKNRSRYIDSELVLPGKAILIHDKDEYTIFVPDYDAIQKQEKRAKKENKKLSIKERQRKAVASRKKQRVLKRYSDKTIANISFTQREFVQVLKWIEKNKEQYLENTSSANNSQNKKNKNSQQSVSMAKVLFSAANGALQTLDPHSGIIPKKSWKKTLASAEDSSFEGIGALLRGGGQSNVIIETPLPGSPALRSGIRAGDIIRKVDGQPIDSLSLDQVVSKIRGPKNTVVKLEVERELELKLLVISIKRNVIEQKAVSGKLITKKEYPSLVQSTHPIAYIKINSFLYAKENTSKLIADEYKMITKNQKNPIQFLLLDLRNNPGGYLEEAVSVADLFLPSNKKIVEIRTRTQKSVLKTDKDELIKPNVSIVVLINANSASASEILASAMMDYDRALIVGDRTFGKATVQGIQPLSKVILKLTTARYYSPRGYTVQVSGITPDIRISDEADASFPPRFREEDMWDHLPSLKQYQSSDKRKRLIQQIRKQVKDNRIAESYIQQHKNDAIKVDSMLVRSIAYLYALGK